MASKNTAQVIPVKGKRRLPFWIDSYCEYTAETQSPPLFRKWAGIATIAGALERKVWLQTKRVKDKTFPNLYTFLVGPPAVGKGVAIDPAREMWGALGPEYHMAPTSITGAALADALHEAVRRVTRPAEVPPYIEYNSLLITSAELGTFLPEWDPNLIVPLTDLWDGKIFDQKRRGLKHRIVVENPVLNWLAGTTPDYMNNLLPKGAWEGGFMSRILIIHSGDIVTTDIFEESFGIEADVGKLKVDLLADLKTIASLVGQFQATTEFVKAINSWNRQGQNPKPDHPKLKYYCGRRPVIILKLCMIASVMRKNELILDIEDLETALDWLHEAEIYMPDIFTSMQGGGDSRLIDDIWHFLWRNYGKSKRPTNEAILLEFISERTPSYNIQNIINLMVQLGVVKVGFDKSGIKYYAPGPRKAQE